MSNKKKLAALVADLDALGLRAVSYVPTEGNDYSRGLLDGGINVALGLAEILNKHGV